MTPATIRGVVRGETILLDELSPLPDGTPVIVTPAPSEAANRGNPVLNDVLIIAAEKTHKLSLVRRQDQWHFKGAADRKRRQRGQTVCIYQDRCLPFFNYSPDELACLVLFGRQPAADGDNIYIFH